MTIPLIFPDWVPGWAQLLVLVLAIMLGLAFLMMPFSVFGLKSRLEGVEARLDEIQGEIRALAHRLPEPSHPPVPPARAPVVDRETPPVVAMAPRREPRLNLRRDGP
jgi:hypothetical protein